MKFIEIPVAYSEILNLKKMIFFSNLNAPIVIPKVPCFTGSSRLFLFETKGNVPFIPFLFVPISVVVFYFLWEVDYAHLT